MKRLIKKGRLISYKNGDLSLLNNKYKSWPVDKLTAQIWQKFNGQRSIDQVVQETNQENKSSPKTTTAEVRTLVNLFQQIDLIE